MSTPASARGRHAAIAATLFALTLALFWRAVGNDYVNYDDPDYVSANPRVQAGLTREGVAWAWRSQSVSNWHPLTWMSHMLDWSVYARHPWGDHLSSVLLHALNAALAFLALRRLTGTVWTSAVFAAWFAWHPLRVESVAWIAERKDVLSGAFWFLTLWAYAVYTERRRMAAKGAGTYYVLALLAFALGLSAKPMLVTLPCVLLLLDIWPLRRWRLFGDAPVVPLPQAKGTVRSASAARVSADPANAATWRTMWWEKLPFFALAAASSAITYLAQKSGGAVTEALTLGQRLGNAGVAIVRYLGKFTWPADLAVLYPHPGDWPLRKVGFAVVVVAGLSALAWTQRRRRPWVAIGWLWFLGTLVPVLGLVQVGLQSMADRYTYLPMLGVQIAVLWTLRGAIAGRPRTLWATLAAGGLLVYAGRTWTQIGVWRDSGTLFTRAIEVTRDNYVAHDNRGLFYFKAGRMDEALADYRRALAINPRYLNANNNLGHALAQLGRPAEALPHYRTAYAANPQHLEVRNNLANALSDLNQLDEAMQHYAFVLKRNPEHANALNGSAVVLAMQGQPAEAKGRLEQSLRLMPGNPSAHNNLGNVCSMLGLKEEAIQHYRRATELNPREAHAFLLLGSLLNEQQKFGEAADSFRRAIAAAPGHADAHAQLGLALARLGQRDAAAQALRTALQHRPDHAQARAWLQAVMEMK